MGPNAESGAIALRGVAHKGSYRLTGYGKNG